MSTEQNPILNAEQTSQTEDETTLRHRLDLLWSAPKGLWGWLINVNHTSIGKRYIITAFIFFVLGGLEAALMRLQLSRPENGFIGPDLYNQIFTMHGSTMMFLFAVPIMEGIGLYLVPLMIGTRNVAFPKLNLFGYYTYLFGGLFLYAGFLMNIGPDAGWFSYVPLAGPEFSPGKRVDIWAQMISFTEVAALVGAIEIIVTVLKQRAPGMTLNRIPLFVWASFITAFMVIFAMPAIIAASSLLATDRLISTHFFNPAEGGDALLYQHLFWFFGHPEVYIIFIPALGMVSSIISTFTRRQIFGYPAMVLSLVATAFIGFGLWVHHMFVTGLPQLGGSFFTSASMMIAIPTGVQIFCWIATLWKGKIRLATPMLYVLGFFTVFIVGGLTGIMIASIPFDSQVHDTFFIVAHFHYTLIGGAVFPLLGAVYYWFPKVSGKMLDERMGKISFWLLLVGFNLTFFPMHILGLHGMTRRVYTYLATNGWGDLNLLASIGAGIMALSLLTTLINAIRSIRHGVQAGDNPWEAPTLEWSTSSPPPSYNYLYLPIVEGHDPLWTSAHELPGVTGLSTDHREVLVVRALDAVPDHRHHSIGHSHWPLILALAVGIMLVAVIFTPWALPAGSVLFTIALTGWYWPNRKLRKLEEQL